MRIGKFGIAITGVVLACAGLLLPANAATIELTDGQSFEAAAESLGPGDILIVHAGTYFDSGRIAITVKGTPEAPVVIQGAPGEARPRIGRRSTDPAQNTINIEGATHLTLSGLEITGNGGNGGDGINMSGGPSHILLEDLKIHDVSVGVNFRSSMHHITVRRSEIYDTYDTGEGLYIGCHDGDCVVRDSLIEGNWIHHTRNADQGDGIEIKKASHSNIVRDNVIHDTRYPCIIAYGTAGNPPNVIERNVMWNCDDAGMQVAADAVIRNNVIIPGAGGGLTSQDHAGVTPNNLQFIHNTIVGGSPCLRLSSWNGKSGLVFANNAIYCPDGDYSVSGLSGVVAAGNVFSSAPPSFPSSAYRLGRTAALDLTDVAARNVYPTATSTLIGAAASAWLAADDFNGTSRNATADAGAYVRTSSTNPGCAIAPGFKCAVASPPAPPSPPPQVSFSADPASVAYQAASMLSWNATNASTCTAQGDWSGTKALTGSESTGALVAQRNYTLRCTNSEGVSASRSVTVAVAAATPAPQPPAPAPTPPPSQGVSSGGGGALDAMLVVMLGLSLLTMGFPGRSTSSFPRGRTCPRTARYRPRRDTSPTAPR
jgi:hypothetical protein